MRFSDLARKDVISIDSGALLGQVIDLEIDDDYRVRILYVSLRPCGIRRVFPWLFASEEHMVHVEEIVRIGKDVVLVRTC